MRKSGRPTRTVGENRSSFPIRFGRGRSLVEFCDLFNREEKVLLHVKRYGGSAPLSHLFQQALVSGEAFRTESEFRRLANAKLPAGLPVRLIQRCRRRVTPSPSES